MRKTIHDWRMHLKPDKTFEDLSQMYNPIVRGWSTIMVAFTNQDFTLCLNT